MNASLARLISNMIPFRNLRRKVRDRLLQAESRRVEKTFIHPIRMVVHKEMLPLYGESSAIKAEIGVVQAGIDAMQAGIDAMQAGIDAMQVGIDAMQVGAGVMQAEIRELRAEIVTLQGEMNAMQREAVLSREEAIKAKEYAKVSAFNQIALNIEDKEGLSIYLPDIYDDSMDRDNHYFRKKDRFSIQLNPTGGMSFCPIVSPRQRTKRIFVSTLGKTGTHFIDMTLKELGYQQISYFSVLNSCVGNINGIHHRVNLPFCIQEKLVLPGQYMVGHMLGDDLLNLSAKGELLLSIRDLRYIFVSLVRMFLARVGKSTKLEEISPQQLIASLHDERPGGHDFFMSLDLAKSFLPLIDKVPIIRFEELIAEDYEKAWPSLNAIANIAECPPADVFTALKKNFRSTGTDTATGLSTYMGSFTEIEGIWTPAVEDVFVSTGADIVNEQLGYPRSYRAAK